jgi:hypothetical protein
MEKQRSPGSLYEPKPQNWQVSEIPGCVLYQNGLSIYQALDWAVVLLNLFFIVLPQTITFFPSICFIPVPKM